MTEQDRYLIHLANEGAKRIYGNPIPKYIVERMRMELDVITNNKFTDYILMIWDIHDFCRSKNRVTAFCEQHGYEVPEHGVIPLGPGRGSVGGSTICYVIGIHECDPILFGLYFERFLNPERIAYPDIDFDISARYRYLVIAYIANRYGTEHVAQIITYGTLAAKTACEETLKAANVPSSYIKILKDIIPEDPEITLADMEKNDKFVKTLKSTVFPDYEITIDATMARRILSNDKRAASCNMTDDQLQAIIDTNTQCKYVVHSSWDWDKALRIMKRLEGLKKHESSHAAGVVVAPVVLNENIPLMRKSGTGSLASQYDMVSLEQIGYLKMDALGLKTVDANFDAGQLVRKWYDQNFDMGRIRLDDNKAMNLIRSGDTVGIFQMESTGFTQMMQDLQIGSPELYRKVRDFVYDIEKQRGIEIQDFMWIAAGIALYRPGPLDAVVDNKTMVQHLIDRKLGKEPTVYMFPEEESYLSETYGIMTYQEQVMARVRQMTGCTYGRADMLRRAMGKKDAVAMRKEMDWFEEHAMACDFTKMPLSPEAKIQMVRRAIEEIKTFARYGFNKSHAVEYAFNCYRSVYFKANYPVAFYTALLNSNDDPKHRANYIRDMVKHDVSLLPPLVSRSNASFTMTAKDTVRFGLSAIKGIGDKGMQSILAEKVAHGAYHSVEEFRVRVPATLINKTAMVSLAKCGAFDDILSKGQIDFRNRMTLVNNIEQLCESISKFKARKSNKDISDSELMSRIIDSDILVIESYYDDDKIQYAQWEKELLNFFISAHPIDAYADEIRRWTAIDDMDEVDLPNEFYIAGFVASCHETIIKKEGRNKGKPMGFVTIETASRSYEATLFPGIYESCLPYISTGNPAVLKGKRDVYKDKITIQGVYMRNLMNTGIRDCPECHIYASDINIVSMMELRNLFGKFPGITQVNLYIRSGYNELQLRPAQTISLNDYLIRFIEDNIGMLYYKQI
jgi:DNA polymerase-3 subunit alpha